MRRSDFIKTGCSLCIGLSAGVGILSMLESCASGKVLKKPLSDGVLTVSESEFEENKSFVIVRTETINFDILLNRKDASTYTAVLMQCTHYDNPVYANNRMLFCPTHGSTFDYAGKATKEPATRDLKQYKTEKKDNLILIYLS